MMNSNNNKHKGWWRGLWGNRLLPALALVVTALVAISVATASPDAPASRHGMGVGWDPYSPHDPYGEVKYRLTLVGDPEGSFNIERETYWHAYTHVDVIAYDTGGYRFVEMLLDGEVVSTEREYTLRMPDHNATLTARYVYDPEQPDDPYEGPLHRHLSVRTEPVNSVSVNWCSGTVEVGQVIDICPSRNKGFEPVCIEINGQRFDDPYRAEWLVEKEEHVDVVVYAVYNPYSPDEVMPNFWDPQTGEMVISYFSPRYLGDMIDAVLARTRSGHEDVRHLKVIGEMDESDWGCLRNFTQTETIDLSQVTGTTEMPSYAFEYGNARDIALPALSSIHYSVFYSHGPIEHLSVWAPTPPDCDCDAFYGANDIYENCVLHVPPVSIPLYRETAPWNKFVHIEPLRDDVRTLTLELPDASQYAGYRLELCNLRTAMRQRCSIDSRTEYDFACLDAREPYTVRMFTPAGLPVASIPEVPMDSASLKLSFDTILPVHDISAVVKAGGRDVTGDCQFEWYTPHHVDGSPVLLSRSATLRQIPDSVVLECRAVPTGALARQYNAVSSVPVVSGEDQGVLTVTLPTKAELALSGTVTDEDGNAVSGAAVTISNPLNAMTTLSQVVTPDAQGCWSASVVEGASNVYVTYSAPSCVSHTDTVRAEMLAGAPLALDPVRLHRVNAPVITLSLSIADLAESGDRTVKRTYTAMHNLDIEVYDVTQDREITLYDLTGNQLTILDDDVKVNDKLTLTLHAKDGAFVDTASSVTIGRTNKATATISLVGNGAVKAVAGTDLASKALSALLYDEDGYLVAWSDYNGGEAKIAGITAGAYTLATIDASRKPLLAPTLGLLEASGVGCATAEVTVSQGKLTTVQVDQISETADPADAVTRGSSLVLDRAVVNTGGYATVSVALDIVPDYAAYVKEPSIRVFIPEGVNVIYDSAVVDGRRVGMALDGDFVIVPIEGPSVLSFAVTPDCRGERSIYALAAYTDTKDGEDRECQEPIGNVILTASDLVIAVPELTATAEITASGVAPALSEVLVYESSALIARAMADADGRWSAVCTMSSTGAHDFCARIVDVNGATVAEAMASCVYDPKAVVPVMTEMHVPGATSTAVHFDFANTRIAETHYVPGDAADLVFATEMSQADGVASMMLHVLASDGSLRHLPACLDPAIRRWIAVADCVAGAYPTNISVSYQTTDGVDHGRCDGCYFPVSVLPESVSAGFVYEGDYANRLEGVKATLLHKREIPDSYGDYHTVIDAWDAEAHGQHNPQYTDALGHCRWDVPEGMWQVRYEKDGYLTVETDWMTLPSPLLQVNTGMQRTEAPAVDHARAYEQGVEISFDQPMDTQSLNTDNILVLVDTVYVKGDVIPVMADGDNYTRRCRFVPERPLAPDMIVRADTVLTPDTVITYDTTYVAKKATLIVSRRVRSHAGMKMNGDYVQTLTVAPEITAISVPELLTLASGEQASVEVLVASAEAAAGRTLRVVSNAKSVVRVDTPEVVIDDSGVAEIKLTGAIAAKGTVTLSIDDCETVASLPVEVTAPISALCVDSVLEMRIHENRKLAIYALPSNMARGAIVNVAVSEIVDEENDESVEPALTLSCGDSFTLNGDATAWACLNATKGGRYAITWSLATERGDTVTAQTLVNVLDFIPGDANGDNVVSVTDITMMVSHILGSTPTGIVLAASDLNGDGKVTVTDITGVVNIILSGSSRAASRAVQAGASVMIDDVVMDASGTGLSAISLSATDALGVQFDLMVPDGMTVADIQLGEANATQYLAWSEVSPGCVRVVAYSGDRLPLCGDTMFYVIFTAEGETAAGATVSVAAGVYATVDGGEYRERVMSAASASVTGVNSIADAAGTSSCRIYAEGGTLVVEAPADCRLVLSTADGRYRVITARQGVNRYEIAQPGLVIVNGAKFMIK